MTTNDLQPLKSGSATNRSLRVAIVGNFGLRTKGTMIARALPIARALVGRGHAVSCLLPPWDSPADAGRREVADGIPVAYTRVPPPWPLLRHALLALDLFRLAWRERPDVLYAFKPKAYAGAVLMLFLAARRLGLYAGRVVLDTDDWEGDGGWNDRERDRFGWLARRFIAWHERWCLRHADAVTYASRALEPLARRAGATRLHYVPICVDGSSRVGFSADEIAGLRSTLGLGDGPVVLAYTRLAEFDPARLAATFARVSAARSDARLLVVGRGLHGEEAAFATAVDELGIADRVVCVGWIAADEVPRYLGLADVALQMLDDNLLTRTKGQAKLLELLAAGVPVVADAVGQANDYIADGRTGILVAPGDERAMADAALALLADPDRRREIGGAAASDVRVRWSWAAWLDGLESALAGPPPTTDKSRAIAHEEGSTA